MGYIQNNTISILKNDFIMNIISCKLVMYIGEVYEIKRKNGKT